MRRKPQTLAALHKGVCDSLGVRPLFQLSVPSFLDFGLRVGERGCFPLPKFSQASCFLLKFEMLKDFAYIAKGLQLYSTPPLNACCFQGPEIILEPQQSAFPLRLELAASLAKDGAGGKEEPQPCVHFILSKWITMPSSY